MASTDSEYFIESGSRMADVISPTQQAAPQGTTRVSDYEWVHDDIRRHASECTSAVSIDDLRLQLTAEGKESYMVAEPCTKGEWVCARPTEGSNERFTMVYETLFSGLGERNVLRTLNIAPS